MRFCGIVVLGFCQRPFSTFKTPLPNSCNPGACRHPALLPTSPCKAKPSPAESPFGAPHILTAGCGTSNASRYPLHTDTWARFPVARRAVLGLVISFESAPSMGLSQARAQGKAGNGKAVLQPSRPASRSQAWLCAPPADPALPETSRPVPGTPGPRGTLTAAQRGVLASSIRTRGASPARFAA